MSQHHNDHNNDDEQNHDDCQDCKRQRAQNEILIDMYQKLQQVDKRTNDVKGSIVSHQDHVEKNMEIIKKIDQKLEKTKSQKQQQSLTQFGQLGFKLYADMLEKEKKSQAQKENQRLKLILKNIYQSREKDTKVQKSSSRNMQKQSSFMETSTLLPQLNKTSQSTAAQWFDKSQFTSRSDSRKSQSFRETEMGKSFQISSTKSSFNMTKRKIFEKKDFQELNLWLFEQRHQILEKELYEKPVQQSQIFKQTSLSKTKGRERYVNNAKNAVRLDVSTVLRKNSFKKQHRSIMKRDHASIEIVEHNDSQRKTSLNLESIRGVLPQHISNSRRFYNNRIQKDSLLPAISGK